MSLLRDRECENKLLEAAKYASSQLWRVVEVRVYRYTNQLYRRKQPLSNRQGIRQELKEAYR